MPVIDALRAGIKPVLSDIPVFHEIAGPHAHFFDPTNSHELAEAIERAVQENRSEEVRNYSLTFTWERAAQRLLGVYQGLTPNPFAHLIQRMGAGSWRVASSDHR